MTTDKNIRVRMAPSPTGALHVGTSRTAIFNYLFAKHNSGEFVMRIEDTDTERSKKEWEQDILDGLKWLGLEWDEFYRQSERREVYAKYIQKLLDEGKAFYCWHTKEELQRERGGQMEEKKAPKHFCSYRDEQPEDPPENSVVRLKNDTAGTVEFEDLVRNRVKFYAPDLGDFSIARNEQDPLYNLAVVIDDNDMQITHVIRGEDHIPNTPRQILLLQALGMELPQYAHIPLLLGPDKSKLSKRHGSTSVSQYREEGYLPEAMFNFLALLGWRPKEDEIEIMGKDEIISKFEISDIQKSGAVFDVEKLGWMNGQYIRELPKEDLVDLCIPYLESGGLITEDKKKDRKWLKKVISLERERIKKLSDITEGVEFIFHEPEYEPDLLVWKKSDKKDAVVQLEKLNGIIENIEEDKTWTKEDLESIIMPPAEESGDRGKVLWPLRVALSGKKASPGPFEILEVLGKGESMKRIEKAVKLLSS